MPGTGQCYVCDVINIIIDFTVFAEQVLCARHYSRNIVHSCENIFLSRHIFPFKAANNYGEQPNSTPTLCSIPGFYTYPPSLFGK